MGDDLLQIEGLTDAEVVGRGGFGVVYRARDVSHGRDVAVKILTTPTTPADRQRFDRERRAMGSLGEHPNIVPVYASGYTPDGQPYLVMEYAPGGSLAHRLAQQGPLPWPEAVDIVAAIASGTQAAHDAGILHRDIKPENILVARFGAPKLTDFGIASLAGGTTTAAGASASLAHASPELLEGRPVTVTSDVYALGSTLYTLVTGTPPFRRSADEAPAAMIRRILAEPVPDLRPHGIPDELAREIERAMAKDPDARHPSAADLVTALAAVTRPASEVAPLAAATVAEAELTDVGGIGRDPVPATADSWTGGAPLPPPPPTGPPGGAEPGSNRRRALVAAAIIVAVLLVGTVGAVVISGSGGGGETVSGAGTVPDDDTDDEEREDAGTTTTTEAVIDAKVSINCPTEIPLGTRVVCEVVTEGASQAFWHIPGFTPSPLAFESVPGANPVFIEPTDPSFVGSSFTLQVGVTDEDGRSATIVHEFVVAPAQESTPPSPDGGGQSSGGGGGSSGGGGGGQAAAPVPTVSISCPGSIALGERTVCDVVSTNATSGSWNIPGFDSGSLATVPGSNPVFIEPTDPGSVGSTFTLSAVVRDDSGRDASASHSFTVTGPPEPPAPPPATAPSISIDCPGSISLGVRTTCNIVTSNATQGSWSIPGFAGTTPLSTVPGTNPIFIEPSNPSSVGSSFTLTVTAQNAAGENRSASHTFTVTGAT